MRFNEGLSKVLRLEPLIFSFGMEPHGIAAWTPIPIDTRGFVVLGEIFPVEKKLKKVSTGIELVG